MALTVDRYVDDHAACADNFRDHRLLLRQASRPIKRKTLKEGINRQTQKAAAQNAKEQARQDREALEEKVKNAKAALFSTPFNTITKSLNEMYAIEATIGSDLRSSVIASINIFNL